MKSSKSLKMESTITASIDTDADGTCIALHLGGSHNDVHKHGIPAIQKVFKVEPVTNLGDFHRSQAKGLLALSDQSLDEDNISADAVVCKLKTECDYGAGPKFVDDMNLKSMMKNPIVIYKQLADCGVLYGNQISDYIDRADMFTDSGTGYFKHLEQIAFADAPDAKLRGAWNGDIPEFAFFAKSSGGQRALLSMFQAMATGLAGYGLDEDIGGLYIVNLADAADDSRDDSIIITEETNLF